jgi:hypothetical protein
LYDSATPAVKQQIVEKFPELRGALEQPIRKGFQDGGFGQPSAKNIADRSKGTLNAFSQLHENGTNPFDRTTRGQAFGGSGKLAVPLTAGAGSMAAQQMPDAFDKIRLNATDAETDTVGPGHWSKLPRSEDGTWKAAR